MLASEQASACGGFGLHGFFETVLFQIQGRVPSGTSGATAPKNIKTLRTLDIRHKKSEQGIELLNGRMRSGTSA